MEKKKVITNITKKKKRSKPRLSTSSINTIDLTEYRKVSQKQLSIGSKNNTLKECEELNINEKKYVEKTSSIIEKIYRDKEEKLLNLIVRIIVKSTLEHLYGKEGN